MMFHVSAYGGEDQWEEVERREPRWRAACVTMQSWDIIKS